MVLERQLVSIPFVEGVDQGIHAHHRLFPKLADAQEIEFIKEAGIGRRHSWATAESSGIGQYSTGLDIGGTPSVLKFPSGNVNRHVSDLVQRFDTYGLSQSYTGGVATTKVVRRRAIEKRLLGVSSMGLDIAYASGYVFAVTGNSLFVMDVADEYKIVFSTSTMLTPTGAIQESRLCLDEDGVLHVFAYDITPLFIHSTLTPGTKATWSTITARQHTLAPPNAAVWWDVKPCREADASAHGVALAWVAGSSLGRLCHVTTSAFGTQATFYLGTTGGATEYGQTCIAVGVPLISGSTVCIAVAWFDYDAVAPFTLSGLTAQTLTMEASGPTVVSAPVAILSGGTAATYEWISELAFGADADVDGKLVLGFVDRQGYTQATVYNTGSPLYHLVRTVIIRITVSPLASYSVTRHQGISLISRPEGRKVQGSTPDGGLMLATRTAPQEATVFALETNFADTRTVAVFGQGVASVARSIDATGSRFESGCYQWFGVGFPSMIVRPPCIRVATTVPRSDSWYGGTTADTKWITAYQRADGDAYQAPCIVEIAQVDQSVAELSGINLIPAGVPSVVSSAGVGDLPFPQRPGQPRVSSVAAAGGSLGIGTFSAKIVWSTRDSEGRLWRSAPSIAASYTFVGGAANLINWAVEGPALMRPASKVYLELYRTVANGSVYYLDAVTSLTEFTGFAGVSTVREVALSSTQSDALLADNETLYTEGGVLANDPLPSCNAAASYGGRIFAHVGGGKIRYSKTIVDGVGLGFPAESTIDLGSDLGEVLDRGLVSTGDTLYCFCERGIFGISGEGPQDNGQGQQFSRPLKISETIAMRRLSSPLAVEGGVFFQSNEGLHILSGASVTRIGDEMEDELSNLVSRFVRDPIKKNVLCVQPEKANYGQCLVYDYEGNTPKWSLWKGNALYRPWDVWASGSDVWSAGTSQWCKLSRSSFVSAPESSGGAGGSITTGWINLAQFAGYQRLYWIGLLVSKESANDVLSFHLQYDFNDTSTAYDARASSSFPAMLTESIPYIWKIKPSRQKCVAVRMIVTWSTAASLAGRGVTLAGLFAEIGVKKGTQKRVVAL